MMGEPTKKDRIETFYAYMRGALPGTGLEALAGGLEAIGFFDAPASTRFHGCFEGGLFLHSLDTARNLALLTQRLDLKWREPRSPRLVGMLHDLCKCDQYERNGDGRWEMRKDLILTGHGDKSVIIAQRLLFAAGVSMTEEEVLCIRWHMGAYDDAKIWNSLGAAIKKYPNVLFTHTADMMAARVHGK